MPSRESWKATCEGLGMLVTPPLVAEYERLIARYSEPHRKYHTVRHLDECFGNLEEIRALAVRPAEVELALWYHDAIYDTRASDNEARSAALAAAAIRAAGGREEQASRVAELIMATKHDAVPAGIDAEVLVDVDLSILGAPPGRFDEYEKQVREEYSWVPGFVFRKERRRILEGLLARPAIFSTDAFRERYESRARENMRRSIG